MTAPGFDARAEAERLVTVRLREVSVCGVSLPGADPGLATRVRATLAAALTAAHAAGVAEGRSGGIEEAADLIDRGEDRAAKLVAYRYTNGIYVHSSSRELAKEIRALMAADVRSLLPTSAPDHAGELARLTRERDEARAAIRELEKTERKAE